MNEPEGKPQRQKRVAVTFDELVEMASQVARDEDHPDRFRYMNLLKGMNAAAPSLPLPLSDAAKQERLVRVLRPCGKKIAAVAYKQAFKAGSEDPEEEEKGPPLRRREREEPPWFPIDEAHLTEDSRAILKRISTWQDFVREFPEMKQRSRPKGFPHLRGEAAVQAWCWDRAIPLLIEKQNQDLKALWEQDRRLKEEEEAE